MGTFNKILVALDGSDASKNALGQALALANDHKSWILAITVMPAFAGDLELTGVGDVEAAIHGPGQAILEEAREIARADRGLAIRTILEHGEPYQRIIDTAEAEGCDLIVLGRQGRGPLAGAIVGRVATRVIGYSKVDVLVVPEEAVVQWSRILLATDGSRYSAAATRKALDFAKAYGDALDVIAVAQTNDEFQALAPKAMEGLTAKARGNVEEVARLAAADEIQVRTVVREGDPAEAIAEYVEQSRVDAVFMGSHGRTGLRRLLMGSVTERVIGRSACPVLVVNFG